MIHSPGHMLPVKYCFLGYTSELFWHTPERKENENETN